MAHFFFKKNFCWWSQPEFKSKWCQKNICPIGLNKTKEGKWKNIKLKSKEKHLKVIYLTLVIEGSPWPIWETRSSLKEIYYFSRFKFWNQSLSLSSFQRIFKAARSGRPCLRPVQWNSSFALFDSSVFNKKCFTATASGHKLISPM